MPYTYKSLVFVWLIALGLLALTISGVVAGSWSVLLVAAGLAAPALILRSPARATAISRQSHRATAHERAGSPLEVGAIDVYRWENEGGAQRRRVSGGSLPALAAR
jgi:uncharacterized protein (DUF58 family)